MIEKGYIFFQWQRINDMSFYTIIYKSVVKILGLIIGILLQPIALIFHLIGYRHVPIFTDRIGHLALEPDCLLKAEALSIVKKKKWILLAPYVRTANEHLLKYWSAHFTIVRSNFKCFLISNMSFFGLMRFDVYNYSRKQGGAQESFKIYSKWGKKPPILNLSLDDIDLRTSVFKDLGIPEGSWFVCVHAREDGFSKIDESIQFHRNSSIENYIPAIKLIVKNGGWVIRIGDASTKPLPPMGNVIDYAHHRMKSPRLDVILSASCEFVLGSTSGICLVSSIFGKPSAIANIVPYADLWYGPCDISIPKRIWSKSDHRYLSLEESLKYPHGCFKYPDQYLKTGFTLIENNSEDIAELTREMMYRIKAKNYQLPEDKISREIYKLNIDKRYQSIYSSANLAAFFYRKYK
jgi:putative glycosyltransferase (TIGR04372 family)